MTNGRVTRKSNRFADYKQLLNTRLGEGVFLYSFLAIYRRTIRKFAITRYDANIIVAHVLHCAFNFPYNLLSKWQIKSSTITTPQALVDSRFLSVATAVFGFPKCFVVIDFLLFTHHEDCRDSC